MIKTMMRWIGAMFDRLCVIACALICVQLPLFISEYVQQLTGREAELRFQVSQMERSAHVSGKTLPELIQKFLSYHDNDFVLQGELMQGLVNRWRNVDEALLSLQNSSPFKRPVEFFLNLDSETFRSTFQNYTFGVPFTWEGGVYALIGVILGYGLCSFVRRLFQFRKKADKQPPA